jgi:hypothetical protein
MNGHGKVLNVLGILALVLLRAADPNPYHHPAGGPLRNRLVESGPRFLPVSGPDGLVRCAYLTEHGGHPFRVRASASTPLRHHWLHTPGNLRPATECLRLQALRLGPTGPTSDRPVAAPDRPHHTRTFIVPTLSGRRGTPGIKGSGIGTSTAQIPQFGHKDDRLCYPQVRHNLPQLDPKVAVK